MTAASTRTTVTDLVGGTAYQFRLYIVGGSNAGYSNVVNTTTGTIPNTSLALKLNGTYSVTLQWTAPVGARTVVVQKSTNGSAWATAANVTATATQTTVSGLTGNTAYTFRLLITGGTNNGTSNELAVTTIGLATTSLRSTAATDTTATFAWTGVPGASSLALEQSSDGGMTWTTATTGALAGTATTATVTGLSANTTYKFRLAVTGGAYGTTGGNNNNVVTVTTTLVPVHLTLADTEATTVDLTWTASTGASSVRVQQSINGTSWTDSQTTTAINAASTGTTVKNLIGGTVYQFRIYSIGGTYAGYSNVVSTTTGTIPNTSLALKLNGTYSVTLQWTAPVGARSVAVQKSVNGGAWTTAVNVSTTATQVAVSGLGGNTAYKFRLLISGGTNNGTSNELSVTTIGLTSTSLRSTAVTDTTATFAWTAVPGASSLALEQSDDGGMTWTTATTGALAGTATTATVTGLSANTNYKFRLAVTGGAYGTTGGNANNVVTVKTTPVPVHLTLADTEATTVDLTWTASTGASSVRVQQSTNGGVSWTDSQTTTAINAASTSTTVKNLIGGTAYQFRIYSVGGTYAGYSNAVSTTTGTIPNTSLALKLNGTYSVTLQWTAPTGARSVVVQKSVNGGSTWLTAANVSTTATQVAVSGLGGNTAYKFRLLISGGTNNGTSNELSVTTIGLTSTSLRSTAVTDTTATFAWTAVPGATSLALEQSDDGGMTWTTATTGTLAGTATTATVTGLSANTNYKFRLAVTGGAYGTTGGNANNVVTVKTTPVPVHLTLADTEATTVDLTWTASTGASSVRVQQSTNGGVSWTDSQTTTAINAASTSTTVKNLIGGTAYQFRIYSVGGTYAGYSNAVSTTTGTIPNTSLALKLNGTYSVTLQWTAPTGARSVVVQKSVNGGSTWLTAANVSTTATQAVVSGLGGNTAYKFRLLISGGTNNGTSNELAVTTIGLTSTSLRSTAVTDTTATFAWTAVPGASSLALEQSDDGGVTWTTATTGTLAGTATTATVTGLSANTNYKFRLAVTGGAYGTTGGNANNVVTVKTTPVPVHLTLADTEATTVDLTWTASTGASSVRVQQSTNGGVSWTDSQTTTAINAASTSTTVKNLIGGTAYQFRIYSVGGTYAGYSNAVSTTTGTIPNTSLALKLNGTYSVTLQWTAPTGAKSVVVQKSVNGGSTWTTAVTVSTTATQVAVTGLGGNTAYKFRLLISGGTNNGTSNELAVTTIGLTSTSLRSTAVTDTTATFAWTAVPGASSLALEQSDDGGVTWTTATTGTLAGTATTATVTGLSANTNYKFRLAVTGGAYGTTGGNGNNVVAVRTTPVPVHLTLADTEATTVDLTWTASTGASSVRVQQSTNGGVSWTDSQTTTALTAASTGTTVKNLIGGTAYQFRIYSVGGTYAGYSNAVSTTTGTIPNTSLALKLNGTYSVTLQWTAPTGAKSVVVQKSVNGGAWTTAVTVSTTATQVAVTGLGGNTAYKFRLLISGGTNNGTSNELAVTTIGLTSTSLRSTAVTDTTATFAWTAVPGATSLALEQSSDGVTWTTATTGALVGTATTATVTDLSANTSYKFRLAVTGGAYGTTGGNANNVVTVKTTPVPVHLTLADTEATTVDLTWTASTGASSVRVQQSTNGGVSWTDSQTTTVLTAASTGTTVKNLIGGTAYQFRIYSVGGTYAGYSNAVSATTGTIPNTSLALKLNGTNSVTLQWTAPISARMVVVQKSTDGNTWTTAATVSTTATQVALSGLTGNTTYSFRLLITGGTNDGYSNVLQATTLSVALTSFRATVGANQTVNFYWSQPAGTVQAIRIEERFGDTWSVVPTGILSTTSTSFALTGVTYGQTHFYRLYVVGGINDGPSNVIMVNV